MFHWNRLQQLLDLGRYEEGFRSHHFTEIWTGSGPTISLRYEEGFWSPPFTEIWTGSGPAIIEIWRRVIARKWVSLDNFRHLNYLRSIFIKCHRFTHKIQLCLFFWVWNHFKRFNSHAYWPIFAASTVTWNLISPDRTTLHLKCVEVYGPSDE